MTPRAGAAQGRVAPRRGCVVAARRRRRARPGRARLLGGKRRGPAAGAVVGRGSNLIDFWPPAARKKGEFHIKY